jgi:hypothetical protein
MPMNIIGYIGYAVLIYFAIAWTINIRIQLGVGVPVIFTTLYFLVSALVVGILGINKLHCWWIVPSGFILVILISLLPVHIPFLFHLIKIVSSAFSTIIRLGIPTSRIKAEQDAATKAVIEEFFSRFEKEGK